MLWDEKENMDAKIICSILRRRKPGKGLEEKEYPSEG